MLCFTPRLEIPFLRPACPSGTRDTSAGAASVSLHNCGGKRPSRIELLCCSGPLESLSKSSNEEIIRLRRGCFAIFGPATRPRCARLRLFRIKTRGVQVRDANLEPGALQETRSKAAGKQTSSGGPAGQARLAIADLRSSSHATHGCTWHPCRLI